MPGPYDGWPTLMWSEEANKLAELLAKVTGWDWDVFGRDIIVQPLRQKILMWLYCKP